MNQPRPFLSIGMPVYNGDQFLEEALEALLKQTFTDFELIISDNGSTDKTEEICRKYAALDSRIRYYRNEENLGAAWNYNRVFELSQAEYFKWAAHDDICASEYIERCIEVLEKNPSVCLCYARTRFINERGEYIKENYTDDLNLRSSKPHERYGSYLDVLFRSGPEGCSKISPIWGVMRSDCLKKTPLIGNYEGSDLTLLGELALWGEFFEVPEDLFFRREHSQQSVKANTTVQARDAWFDPQNKKKILLPTWRRFREFALAIGRVSLPLPEKISCYLQLRRWLIFSPMGWRKMARELKFLLMYKLNLK
ncbi:MAG: glycosyltransferase family 2 protein [Limnoraphis robusta]